MLLPAAAWAEKDGTVTNSERRISRQRRFLPLPGEAKPDWWIVTQVAQRMGYADEFAYESAADIFREHAALSAFENNGTRDFDLGALARINDERVRCARAGDVAAARGPSLWRHALFRRWRFLHAGPEGALRRAGAAGAARKRFKCLSFCPQHRPRARPVAHHDPHRPEPAPRPASSRTFRRNSPRGCA